MYSYTLSLTSALDGGGWSMPCSSRFTPANDQVHTIQEAGWTTGLVWMGSENLPPLGFDTRTVQPVASRHTDFAILAHGYITNDKIFFLIILLSKLCLIET